MVNSSDCFRYRGRVFQFFLSQGEGLKKTLITLERAELSFYKVKPRFMTQGASLSVLVLNDV